MATVGDLIRALQRFPDHLQVEQFVPQASAEVGPLVVRGSLVMLTAGRETAREAARWAETVVEVTPGQLAEDWDPSAPCAGCGVRVLEAHRGGCPKLVGVVFDR